MGISCRDRQSARAFGLSTLNTRRLPPMAWLTDHRAGLVVLSQAARKHGYRPAAISGVCVMPGAAPGNRRRAGLVEASSFAPSAGWFLPVRK